MSEYDYNDDWECAVDYCDFEYMNIELEEGVYAIVVTTDGEYDSSVVLNMSVFDLDPTESRTSIIPTPTCTLQPPSLPHSVPHQSAHTIVISLLNKFVFLFALDRVAPQQFSHLF